MLRHACGLAVALLLVVPANAGAEWHFKPFLGFTFEPSTNLVGDLEHAAGLPLGPDVESQSSNVAFGMGVALLGDVFGIEGEWSQSPGFFQARDQELVASSSAQTFTGSVIVAMPRRVAQYRCGRTSSGEPASCVCAASTAGRRFRACFRSTRRLPP